MREYQDSRFEGKLSPRVRGKAPYVLRKWRVGTQGRVEGNDLI